jgi:hypothetical protein
VKEHAHGPEPRPATSNAWEDDVATFVVENLPSSPARVLEIGCGEGVLAHRMAAAGYEVTAIDPNAPEGPIFEQTTIEEFTTSERFDVCGGTFSSSHRRSGRGGHQDHPTPERTWIPDHGRIRLGPIRRGHRSVVPASPHRRPGHEGWLNHRCAGWREAALRGPAVSFADHMQEWGTAEGLHRSAALLAALRAQLDEVSFAWMPYLYPNLQDTTEHEEAALIEAGSIQATGFRFVGARRERSYHAGRLDLSELGGQKLVSQVAAEAKGRCLS